MQTKATSDAIGAEYSLSALCCYALLILLYFHTGMRHQQQWHTNSTF